MIALAVFVSTVVLLALYSSARSLRCESCHRPFAVFLITGRVGSLVACWRCWRANRRRQAMRGER